MPIRRRKTLDKLWAKNRAFLCKIVSDYKARNLEPPGADASPLEMLEFGEAHYAQVMLDMHKPALLTKSTGEMLVEVHEIRRKKDGK